MIRSLILALTLWFSGSIVLASPGPDEIMENPDLEARAVELYDLLRCVVCQSQSLAHSNAGLAEDMRVVVRERLLAGESDQQILDYMQTRYGDYVLLLPPVQANTLALWLMPFIVLIFGGGAAFLYVRKQSSKTNDALSPEEESRLKQLMEEEGQG